MKLALLAVLVASVTAVGSHRVIDSDLEDLIAKCEVRPTVSCLREIRARLSVVAIGRDVDVDEDCDDDRVVDDGDDDDDDGGRVPPDLEDLVSSGR